MAPFEAVAEDDRMVTSAGVGSWLYAPPIPEPAVPGSRHRS